MKTSNRKDIQIHGGAWLALFVALAALLILGAVVTYDPERIQGFDQTLSEKVQSLEGDVFGVSLRQWMVGVSAPGDAVFSISIICLFSLLFLCTQNRREAKFVLWTFLCKLLSLGVKMLFQRPRPTVDQVDVITQYAFPSYPSGHVAHYVVLYGFLFAAMFFVKHWPVWIRVVIAAISSLLILLISVSRIYVGAHWATDVIGGYLLGSICLSILLYFYRRDFFHSQNPVLSEKK